MSTSQNGYSVISSSETQKWVIPVRSGAKKYLPLRPGHAGFLLAHFALYFHEEVEALNEQRVWDDWGWAFRPIRGQSTGYSNHASGTAMDLNATEHPLGKRNTFGNVQENAIHKRLAMMDGTIRWGGDYSGRVDEMHFEINEDWKSVTQVAKRLQGTPRGKRIIAVNSHYPN